MVKGVKLGLFLVLGVLLAISSISAEAIGDDLHINLQTTFSNGTIQPGTYEFTFNISTASDCGTIIYSNVSTLATVGTDSTNPVI